MQNNQMEFGIEGRPANNSVALRRGHRPHRARWWFAQMRAVVNTAMDWSPAPPARPEQVYLRLSR
ncbi:hypothetical protein LBMAG56_15300 [Verrucomicrobiota bacterium]|nr:hypothetical protein LBMAG56_15300 [Verrucomicrobiota bacterium]